MDIINVHIESGVKGRRPDPPVPAEPVTMWMIEQLEIFIADPTTPLVAKHMAAAYLFCCYAVMRVEQAQSCWIDAIRDDEFIQGYVFSTKTRSVTRCSHDRGGHLFMASKKTCYTATAGNSDSTDAGAERTYYAKCGPGNLPTFGGLKSLTVFAKTKVPHED